MTGFPVTHELVLEKYEMTRKGVSRIHEGGNLVKFFDLGFKGWLGEPENDIVRANCNAVGSKVADNEAIRPQEMRPTEAPPINKDLDPGADGEPDASVFEIPADCPECESEPPAEPPEYELAPLCIRSRRKSRPLYVVAWIAAGSLLLFIAVFWLLRVENPPLIQKQMENVTNPQPTVVASSAISPALLAFFALVGLALVIGLLAYFLFLLKKLSNPLYWQIACWFLMVVGILVRPLVAQGGDPMQTTVKGALVAGFVSLGVFPGTMRLLNRLKPDPGLEHVAWPFALGFFLDVAQVAAKTYVPGFGWLK